MVLFSSLEHIFTTIKTKFKILIFCISTGPHGGMWNFQTPCTGGGSNELISKFLSSMILYNHPSYFKGGEINSCRISPLPALKDKACCRILPGRLLTCGHNYSVHDVVGSNHMPDPVIGTACVLWPNSAAEHVGGLRRYSDRKSCVRIGAF